MCSSYSFYSCLFRLTIRRLESEIDSMNPKKLENELKQIEKNLKNDEKKLEKLAQEKRGFEVTPTRDGSYHDFVNVYAFLPLRSQSEK